MVFFSLLPYTTISDAIPPMMTPSSFKLYALDVGFLRRLSRLGASAFTQEGALFSEFKGAFAENYLLRALLPQLDMTPRYWTSDKPRHEVDFIAQIGNVIVPMEVKSGTSVTARRLRHYARGTRRAQLCECDFP